MSNNYNEIDLEYLKKVARGRLHPRRVVYYYLFTSLFGFFGFLSSAELSGLFWECLFYIEMGALVFQVVSGILFLCTPLKFKLQKLLHIFCITYLVKMAIDAYIVLFVFTAEKNTSFIFLVLDLISLVGGIVFIIYCVKRAWRQVGQGAFKIDGPGLYDYKPNDKLTKIAQIGGGAVLLVGIFSRHASESNNIYIYSLWLFGLLLLMSVVPVFVGLAMPESILLLYCKSRFPSFLVTSKDPMLPIDPSYWEEEDSKDEHL
ncbi:hypothetical protein A374_09089 [Fictibacillus macauensis ZFHKF-1]|uniref:Uncharacterized protein n=1 Tax=Fictibacillus macauensis ZFHKF-1 TaxID=1196324 RepID=I8AKA8_9BACL|nr:hypothetical protein [Fictibacillus macauensis]EIT85979.1 hypothetical protein A374_09089 [Fictibacillus macauensis ZFHKF-1]